MPDIADGEVVYVQGSARDPYELKNTGGVYSCSCPAWRNAGGPIDRRTCKHLKAHRGVEAESARLGADVGAPPPRRVKPAAEGGEGADDAEGPPVLLAHKWEPHLDLTGWWMSEKLDGVRAYWDGKRFVSRLGNAFLAPSWFTAGFPDHPLDGELWVGRKQFQDTVSIVRRMDAGEQWKRLRYLVFDVPHLEHPFEERAGWIHAFVSRGVAPYAVAVPHEQCEGVEHLRRELARVEGLGGEGLMMRQPGSKYEVGRSFTLLKVKTFHDAEGRVVAHEPGKGKHKGRVGALVVEMPDGTRFNVGTGLSDRERGDPPPIGAIVTYRYQELSRDGVPRFPSYVGLAVDKAAPTAVSGAALPKPAAPKPAIAAAPRPAIATPAAPAATPVAASTAASAAISTGGTMAGKRMFEFVDGSSSKFWEIWIDGTEVRTRYGRIGAAGQVTVKDQGSADGAQKLYDKLVREKTGKGYVEKTGGAAAPAAPAAAAPAAKPAAAKAAGPDYGKLVAKVEAKAKVKGITLPAGASEEVIARTEARIGQRLPDDVRAFYLAHDGGGGTYFVHNRELLSMSSIADEWDVWKELLDGGDFGANDHGEPGPGVQKRWWIPEWIPMTYDGAGNHHVIDLAPAAGGAKGQVLSFWHDDAPRTVVGKAGFLAWLADTAKFNAEGEDVEDDDADDDAGDGDGGPTSWRRFEMEEKFWAIRLDGTSHTVKFGKQGTNGQEKTKEFGDAGAARKDYDKLVAEKTKKGYEEVDG